MSIASLDHIYEARPGKRKRLSSYDHSGGNDDRFHIKPGETRTFADIAEEGVITHIWITTMNDGPVQDPYLFRKVSLQFYWDEETNPSVLAPIGDFFGLGHALLKNYVSAPLQMSPQDGRGLNCWWPMPFRKRARLEVTNGTKRDLLFYFYVDYEARPLEDDALYFHAQWKRCCPTEGISPESCPDHASWCFEGKNVDGKDNYVILEANGRGHYCGANINIDNLNTSNLWDWPGEGDDMTFIDGEKEPSIHGTGTEDYVDMAWCPQQEYCAPYHGLLLGGEENWKGKISYYRYHIQDPIMFEKSIRVTIEHGHANHRSDDWCTTAYWYQTEPHRPMKPLLPVAERLPVDKEALRWTGKVVLIKDE
jgi:hypothetical protein